MNILKRIFDFISGILGAILFPLIFPLSYLVFKILFYGKKGFGDINIKIGWIAYWEAVYELLMGIRTTVIPISVKRRK